MVKIEQQDIKERVKAGKGTKLQTFNGRNALWDTYQEVLNLVIYLRIKEANSGRTGR